MHSSQALANELGALLQPEFVSTHPTTRSAFAVHGAIPYAVVAPGTLEEVSEVMRVAHQHGAVVVPWGGGTQQLIGHSPHHVDLVVRTERLNRVLIHEPDDLTISVEAGLTVGALHSYLAGYNQMLPIDPPRANQATLGGVIATAMDGPRRLGYGTLRDLLIGITVVEATGRVSRAGGMVVKNVSGFDMMKLYLGSFGTLAIIASANFKLLPLPRAAASLLVRFPSSETAFAFLDALNETQLTPTAAEYLNAGALKILGLDGVCAVAVRAEGLEAAVERHLRDVTQLATTHRAGSWARYDGAAEPLFWTCVANLAQVEQLADREAVIKFSALPAEIATALAYLESWASANRIDVVLSVRALHGVGYARLQSVSAQSLTALVPTFPALQWVATLIEGTPRWGSALGGLDVMRQIKREFDPHDALNRGRFVVNHL